MMIVATVINVNFKSEYFAVDVLEIAAAVTNISSSIDDKREMKNWGRYKD